MKLSTQSRSSRVILPESVLYRLSVSQYHRMIEHGIFEEADRVELLEGLLFNKRSNETEPLARLFRLSVSQFHKMIAHDIFAHDDRVELLDGRLVAKMVHNPIHDAAILLIHSGLAQHLPSDWLIRIQSSVALRDSQPEPDLAVVRGPIRRYFKKHPGISDIGQLVEVAESSLTNDRNEKNRIYARARVPFYWIVNVDDFQIEVYSNPKGGKLPAYRDVKIYKPDQKIPLILNGKTLAEIPVKDLLPS